MIRGQFQVVAEIAGLRNVRLPWAEARWRPITLMGDACLRRRNAAAIGLINLIYNLARYEQIVWLKLRPRTAA